MKSKKNSKAKLFFEQKQKKEKTFFCDCNFFTAPVCLVSEKSQKGFCFLFRAVNFSTIFNFL